MMSVSKEPHWQDYLAPKFWPTWLVILLLRLLAFLPFKAGLVFGSALGTVLYRIAVNRRRVTEVNIGLCFKALSSQQQTALVKDVFKANAIGFVEMAWAYWGNKASIERRTTFVGFELLEEALQHKKGVILLGGHYSGLDIGGLLLSFYGAPFDCTYRPHNNPLMDYWVVRKRSRFTKMVDRKKTRELIRDLRENRGVWIAPDQDLGSKGSVFAPFFGQTAATVTAPFRMTKLNGSPILFLSSRRNPENTGYIIELAAMPGFPSGDELRDAETMNLALETAIRKAPEQYMWVHKRFKTQPDGKQKLYKQAGC